MMKTKILLLAILLSSLLALSACGGYSEDKLSAVNASATQKTDFQVKSGTTLVPISEQLEAEGFIQSRKDFSAYAKQNKLTNLKAGTYALSPSMSSQEILDVIHSGKSFEGTRFTIVEGAETREIADQLEEKGLADKDKFTKLVNDPQKFAKDYSFLQDDSIRSLEGYLYPATYGIKEGSDEETILRQFLNSFKAEYERTFQAQKNNSKLSFAQIMTLASVIERETIQKDEQALVSSVFYNRIEKKMPLQSCATVQYILKEHKQVLSAQDIAIDSKYNTYKYNGLPPGPIASPGKDAILAAVNPEKTDYLFFLSRFDGTGKQVFSVTYEDHMKARKEFIEKNVESKK